MIVWVSWWSSSSSSSPSFTIIMSNGVFEILVRWVQNHPLCWWQSYSPSPDSSITQMINITKIIISMKIILWSTSPSLESVIAGLRSSATSMSAGTGSLMQNTTKSIIGRYNEANWQLQCVHWRCTLPHWDLHTGEGDSTQCPTHYLFFKRFWKRDGKKELFLASSSTSSWSSWPTSWSGCSPPWSAPAILALLLPPAPIQVPSR